MPTFRYQAYAADGKPVKGRREGLGVKDVREQLLADGLYVREIQTVSAGRHKGFPPAVRSVFFRELSALLTAGLPLDRALELLSEHPELGAGGDALPAVRDRIREGGDLSESLREQVPGMREEEAAVLAAGEAAGTLPAVAGELADYLEVEAEMRDQVRTALLYPAVISSLAMVVLGVLVGFLLPAYEGMLEGAGQKLPLLTRVLMGTGRALRSPVGLAGILAIGVVLGRLLVRWRRRPTEFLPVARFRLPVVGGVVAARARARFARTLSLLMEGGVALPQAVAAAGRATGSVWLSAQCEEASTRIAQGARVADAVAAVPVLQTDLPGWIRAGEASGDLAGLLRHAAEGHQRAWRRGLDRSLALLEPLLIVAVGVMILVVALAVLLPMMRINQSLTAP